MSLFEGTAPPNIKSTETVAATAPQYLTDYLTKLSQSGMTSLDVPAGQLVAPESPLTQQARGEAATTLGRYQQPLGTAFTAGQAAAAPITAADISAFYNPYEQQVISDMARQSAENVQRGLLPQLRGAFAGTGAFGSRRYAGAMGQSLADVQQGLLSEQNKLKAAGFQSALDAALRQKTGQAQAASALGGLGTAETAGAKTYLDILSGLGKGEQEYEQAQIEAPLVRAQNVAQILRGYTYPTTTKKDYEGPGNIYGPSPLSQIAGLGSLVGSLFGQQVDPRTGQPVQTGVGWSALDWLKKNWPSGSGSSPGSSNGSPYWWPEGKEGGP